MRPSPLKTDAGRMAARVLLGVCPRPDKTEPKEVQQDLLVLRWVLKVMATVKEKP